MKNPCHTCGAERPDAYFKMSTVDKKGGAVYTGKTEIFSEVG